MSREPFELTPKELARFWSKVNTEGTCFLWTGTRSKYGYGQFRLRGRQVYAHRLMWAITEGHPIPDNLQIDHVKQRGCVNRHCVRPSHLEAVTHVENMRRARNSHCKRGHPQTPENLRKMPPGKRDCRLCHAIRRNAAYHHKRLAEQLAPPASIAG